MSSEVNVLAFNQTGTNYISPLKPPTPTDPSICYGLPNELPSRPSWAAWALAPRLFRMLPRPESGSRPGLEPAAISNRLPGPKIAAEPKTN